MALHLVDRLRPTVRGTWQVIISPARPDEEGTVAAIWTSEYFTSRRVAKQHEARLRRLFKEMHLWEFFQAHYDMMVQPNQSR